MQTPRRTFWTVAIFCACLAIASLSAESSKTKTLESAYGDLIQIDIGESAGSGVNSVALCLRNRTGTEATGFDIRRAAAPRFVASPSSSICTRVTPGRHDLILWTVVDGRFSPVIQTSLDLSHAAGRRAVITW